MIAAKGLGMVDQERIRSAVSEILEAIGEDPSREGISDTPQRVARMYEELFWGIGLDPGSALDTVFEKEGAWDQSVVLRNVPFFAVCEHHLLPFFGHAQIGYVPNGKIAGASKLARALELVSRRPQVQERMTGQLADAIQQVLTPDGAAVVIEAQHLCMTMRGARKEGSTIVTTATRGLFEKGGVTKGELLASLQRRGS